MNKLLLRQIQKHYGDTEKIPDDAGDILKVISDTYDHFEKDRKMLEHSIDLSSGEMIALYANLKKETENHKKSHDELNKIFNNIDNVIFSVDMLNYRLTNISDAAEKVYGYKQYEFFSNPDLWQEVIYPEDKHIVFDQIESLKSGKEVENSYRIIHKSKAIRWLGNKIIPTLNKNGELVRIDGITTDITESKRSEELLHKSEANLRNILENTYISYVLLDTDLNILSFNRLARTLARDELNTQLTEGRNYLDIMPESRREAVRDTIEKVLKEKVTVSYEAEYTFTGNTVKWLHVSMHPIIDSSNRTTGLSIAATDITRRKETERDTLNLVERLQNRNRDLKQFSYIVSHNLRAPIAKIKGLTGLFESEPENPEFKRELLEYITAEADNLDNVVKDINTIITAREGASEVKESVDLENELKLITRVFENELQDSKAEITTDFNPSGIVTLRSYIYSIMYNLISNAIKYRIKSEPLKIHIRTSETDEFIQLSVKDNGSGIDLKKNKDRIFGLYKRFHNNSIPGKGIGLNLVKTQAEALNGRVEVESSPNRGSLFKVYLPKY